MSRYGPLNPPPPGGTIRRNAKYSSVQMSTSKIRGSWPIESYTETIESDTTIDLYKNPFTFISVKSNSMVMLTLVNCNVGISFILEFSGFGKVVIMGLHVGGGSVMQTGELTRGTYFIVMFSDRIKIKEMSNPIV